MPRYFFHIDDEHELIRDLEGSDLPDLDAVRREATESARQIMSQAVLIGRPANGRKFVITNEEGYVLLEFPFKEAICSG
jgi:hypothetical protein